MFVHHIALDPSGTLMATCSSDKTVKVFNRRQSDGGEDVWEHGCAMDDHAGPVLRLAWCQHREHGPLLATAGGDHWIYIYRITVSTHEGRTVTQALRWSPVRGFEKDAITDVAFIPPQQYHVLLLSTASLDGCVRLYEIHQPLQFPCMCKLTPEADFAAAEESGGAVDGPGGSGAVSVGPGTIGQSAGLRGGGGIVSISWFPGAAESTMTLAVGAVSGRFFLYRYLKDSSTFTPLRLMDCLGRTGHSIDGTAGIVCRLPVEDVAWAPPMGRRFQLCAICSRAEVYILRLNCISPSNHDMDAEGPIGFEVFRVTSGAVSASWSRSATLLYLAMDDRHTKMTVLQMRDPRDHTSWQVVSLNAAPSQPAF